MNKGCSICSDPETDENRIVECKKCNVKVHLACYGVIKFSENWTCSPCDSKKVDSICALCIQKGGAMKKTVCSKWVHVICALFTEGSIFENKKTMEPINISGVSKTKRNKICVFCSKATGFCSLCYRRSCKNRLHITCAQRANCLREVTNSDRSNSKIKFRAFCNEHKPVDSKRRISSQFILGRMLETTSQKQQQERSNQMNLEWIVEEAAKTSSEMRPKNPVNDTPSSLDEENAQQHKRDHDLIDEQTASTSAKTSNDSDEKIEEKKKEKKRKNEDRDVGKSASKRFKISPEGIKMSGVYPNPVAMAKKRFEMNEQQTAELDSLQLWWDTRDLRLKNDLDLEDAFNGLEDGASSTENINNEHVCFKDDKIRAVSEKSIQFKFQSIDTIVLSFKLVHFDYIIVKLKQSSTHCMMYNTILF